MNSNIRGYGDIEEMLKNVDPKIVKKVMERRKNVPQRQVDKLFNIIAQSVDTYSGMLENLELELRTGIAFIKIINKRCKTCKSKNKEDLKSCSVCKIVYYCSKECQRKDWKDHKLECNNK